MGVGSHHPDLAACRQWLAAAHRPDRIVQMHPAGTLHDIIDQGQLTAEIALHPLVDGGGGILSGAIPAVLPAPPDPGGEQGLQGKQQ